MTQDEREIERLERANDRLITENEQLRGEVAMLELTGTQKELQSMLDQLGLDFERQVAKNKRLSETLAQIKTQAHADYLANRMNLAAWDNICSIISASDHYLSRREEAEG